MCFYWTPGMPTIFVVLMAVGSFVLIYYFFKMLRAAFRDSEADVAEMDYDTSDGEAVPWRCRQPSCRAMNTSRARYCRMCGASRSGRGAGTGF